MRIEVKSVLVLEVVIAIGFAAGVYVGVYVEQSYRKFACHSLDACEYCIVDAKWVDCGVAPGNVDRNMRVQIWCYFTQNFDLLAYLRAQTLPQRHSLTERAEIGVEIEVGLGAGLHGDGRRVEEFKAVVIELLLNFDVE